MLRTTMQSRFYINDKEIESGLGEWEESLVIINDELIRQMRNLKQVF